MEKKTGLQGYDRRKYERLYASGGITIKAYNGEKVHYYKSYYGDYYKDYTYYSDLYGQAELMNKSYGGIGIKTSIPLEQGYMLEVVNSEEKTAMVRWVVRESDYYYAGLMYTY